MILYKTWLGIRAEISCADCCEELSIHPDMRRPLTPEDVSGETEACTYCGHEVRKEDLS